MKTLLISLMSVFYFINISSQSNSPTFKQIYDFQVDDIFLYRISSTDCGGIPCNHSSYYEKYEILEKILSNDSVTYIRKLNDSSSKDTITYVDSATNILNRYTNEIVTGINYSDTVFLRVRIVNDIIPEKIIGGIGYNYNYNNGVCDTNQILTFNDPILKLAYGQGIGLMSEEHSWFEIGTSIELIGYRKGNDTTGYLTDIVQNKLIHDVQVYPNPFEDRFFIKSAFTDINEIDIFDSKGCLIKIVKNSKNLVEINAADLNKGFYFLRILSKDGCIYKSIIKK